MPRLFAAFSSSLALLLLFASALLSSAEAVKLRGRATGAGPLAKCKVTLSGGTHKASATTGGQGYFELDVPEAASLSALSGSLLRLERGDGGSGGGAGSCLDTAVGLPPPVSLGALVPVFEKGSKEEPFVAINGITTLAYYTKKNVATPQVSPYTKLFGGPEFDAATFYSSFGTTLGIGEARRGGSVDILSLSERGREGPGTPPEKDAVKAQAFSLQVLTSLAVGGRGLAGLKPGVTPDAAAEAMVVATFPAGASIMKSGSKFELSRPASLAAIFNKALAGAPQDVVESVSRSLGWLNEAAAREVLGATSESTAQDALTGGARALKVAQATLGPAAGDVAADGPAGLDAFEASYGTQALVDGLVASADVPGVVVYGAPASDADAAAHEKKSSSSKSSSGSSKSSSSSSSGSAADVAVFAARKEGGGGASRRLLAFA